MGIWKLRSVRAERLVYGADRAIRFVCRFFPPARSCFAAAVVWPRSSGHLCWPRARHREYPPWTKDPAQTAASPLGHPSDDPSSLIFFLRPFQLYLSFLLIPPSLS